MSERWHARERRDTCLESLSLRELHAPGPQVETVLHLVHLQHQLDMAKGGHRMLAAASSDEDKTVTSAKEVRNVLAACILSLRTTAA